MKTLKTTFNTQVLKTNDIQVEFLKTGDIFKIASSHNQINLLQGNMVDGQFSNLYLRKKTDEGYIFERLLGIHSNAVFSIQNDKAVYQGIALGVSYQVVFSLFNNLWHYDVTLEKTEGMYDLIYGQDVGIASYGSILSSEGYTAQYIDHKAFKNDLGYTVCSRQNQGQPHFLQIGSLNETMSYSTDGFQFFGLSYKQTSVPEILSKDMLKNYNYQYEFPYIALQIKPFLLDENKTFTFYGLYVESHEDVTKEALVVPTFEIFDALIDLEKPYKQPLLINPNNQLQVNLVDETYFGDEVKRHKEYKDETLLSFFKDNHKHVILLQKELLVERPHGHLLVHGDLLNATEQVMATTNFMYGVFNSHIVLGNTNFHKLTGDVRNFLNVTKVSGQRMYVDVNGSYQLLGLPSYYELGINYAKWVYVTNQDEIIVTVFAGFNQTQQRTTFESKNNIKYNILVTNQVTMNTNEYEIPLSYDITNDMLRVDVSSNPMVVQHYETLKYLFHVKDASIELADDTFGFDESNSLFVFKYEGKSSFSIDVYGTYDETFKLKDLDFEMEFIKTVNFINSLTGIKVVQKENKAKLEKLSDTVFWYTNNALTHYASPHGLEQYNGAAWGTRDICQGPIELFISAQRYDIVRDILLKVFSRQFIENGDFPQWFMFDKYYRIQAHESHGDIIMWPLKTLANYLTQTGDYSILNEKVSYMSLKTNDFTTKKATVLDHIKKIIKTVKSSFIKDTHLPKYGGGDWDDTLQPANQDLTDKMVSGWTVALFYDAINTLCKELISIDDVFSHELKILKEDVKNDYQHYLVKDGIPAGFVVFDEGKLEYLVHPADENTGLKYRLLALKRPIISEMVNKEVANQYEQIIDQNLKHPDGIRLMNTPVTYRGGKKTYFQRGETAANFGREIGIQYVHAHIRYIEAMAKLGLANKAFEGLFMINPINMKEQVPNASYRQSNVYFSSSDAAFNDRYEAKKDFEKVRTGEIEVKQGWRLYSSGPGIYINQMISNIFGIKLKSNQLWLDPQLPESFDQTVVEYHFNYKPLNITYKKSNETKIMLNGKVLDVKEISNQYRTSGFVLNNQLFKELSQIDITYYYKAN